MREPLRILLVRLSHLGDVVHALAVFHALHEAYPQAAIAWAIQPEFAGLVRGLPGLARVVPFERRGGWRAWPRIRRELAGFGAELCVDAQGNAKSAAVVLCARAPRRAGLARSDWREPLCALVLNERAPPSGQAGARTHALERMLALARFVAPRATHPPRRDPVLEPTELALGERVLAARIGAAEAPVLFHVSSPEDVRAWPLERWGELARRLAERKRSVLVLSGPRERAHAEAIAAALPAHARVVRWSEPMELRELCALYAAVARRGGTLVAGDTGPLHLAAACGLSVVELAGPTDAARTGPWPPAGAGPHAVLRAAPSPPCAPCLARSCHHPCGPVCMSDLQAAVVDAALGA